MLVSKHNILELSIAIVLLITLSLLTYLSLYLFGNSIQVDN